SIKITPSSRGEPWGYAEHRVGSEERVSCVLTSRDGATDCPSVTPYASLRRGSRQRNLERSPLAEKRTHAQCTQLVERESGESNAQLLERGKEESCACVVRVPTTTPTPRDIDPSKRCSASKNAAAAAEQRSAPKFKDASLMSDFRPRLSSQSVRARVLTKKIGHFIATGLHSYTVLEEPAFRELMKCAVPEYNVPSRTTLSRTVVPEMYDAAKYSLRALLHSVLREDVRCIANTTDGLASRAGDSYVQVTCHVLSEGFVP
ncbi:hypothetical protein HPB47_006884, partial [Ixodes persulcatus]